MRGGKCGVLSEQTRVPLDKMPTKPGQAQPPWWTGKKIGLRGMSRGAVGRQRRLAKGFGGRSISACKT
jgi:hypothetical protein